MSIKTIYSDEKKKGWIFDYKVKKYRGYLLDAYQYQGVDKPDKRRRLQFAHRQEAEATEAAFTGEKRNARLGIEPERHQKIITVRELFDKRLNFVSDSDRVAAIRIFNDFIKILPFPDFSVTDVKKSHFTDYNNARLSAGVKAETVHREINRLSPAFKNANEYFSALEDYQPPRIPRPKKPRQNSQKHIITENEKNAIVGYLTRAQVGTDTVKQYENRVRIGRMFEIAWLLGLRFSEIAKLKKIDFDLPSKTLRVKRWKTDSFTNYDFLPDFVCRLIQAGIESSQTDYIFTHSGSRPKLFYILLREAVEASGMTYGRDFENGIVFHDTRHSFVTRLVQVTDLATAQNFSGHSTAQMLVHYAHPTDEARKNAMTKLYGKNETKNLREIFDAVRNDEMDFETFKSLISE